MIGSIFMFVFGSFFIAVISDAPFFANAVSETLNLVSEHLRLVSECAKKPTNVWFSGRGRG